MSRVWSAKELKSHFRALVKEFGGVEAAGVELGISAQRISQLQNPNKDDLPGFLQVMALEAALEKSVVLATAAEAVRGAHGDELGEAAIAAVTKAASALARIHEMDEDDEREEHEIRDVQAITGEAATNVLRLHHIAGRLKPGRRA